ncbi:MAG TPA: M1 family metallopeptidase [Bryobacteraceae bacterium]|jgi:alanyl aminopeptidase
MKKLQMGVATAALICALGSPRAFADERPPTLRLPDTVAPISYRAELTLDPSKDDFSGTIAIKIKIAQPTGTIWLNATQIGIIDASLTSGGRTYRAKTIPAGDDFIGLRFEKQVPAEVAELLIHYTGKVRQQDSSGIFGMEDNGNKYIFTQFESTDARGAFPCFDEPSYKVPWQLTLTVPAQDTAISNTPIAEQQQRAGSKVYVFKQTKPLPSYLVAFAVGPFEYVDAGTAGRNHVPVRIVTPKGHADEAQYAAKVTATILTRLEDYFGIPYPYEKSDNVAIPVTFGFGAMENAGMVTYGQSYILAKPENDTTTRQRLYASVAAHELAHQWFGDLVTTAWWNDIWLNEAFATWMEQKLIAEWKPEWNTRVADVDSKLNAEKADSLLSSRKIRQEIVTKGDIGNAFDSITYDKGAAVIGMFENWVGPEEFRKGVQKYLKQYAFRNATAPEFLDAIGSTSQKEVTKAFSTFLNQAGVPLVSVSLDCKQNAPTLRLHQERSLPLGSKAPVGQQWNIPVCIRYGSGETAENACTMLTQSEQAWPLKAKNCPAWVEGNANAVGYYRVRYQGQLLADLTDGDAEQRLRAPERVNFMGDARALSDAGRLAEGDSLKLVETFHADPDRHVVEKALDLALAPREHLIPANLMANYERFLRRNFDARARELGWVAKPGEPDDIRLLRPTLLHDVATYAQDEELAHQARELAEEWLKDHSSVNPNLVTAVLESAAYYGDKAFFDRLLAELEKTKDRSERRSLRAALAAFRDPAALEEGMQALLSGKIPFIEGAMLLFAGQGFAETRKIPLTFLKAHYDEILAKRPTGGGFDFAAELPRVGQSYCDAQSKQELESFFEPRIANLLGGSRMLSQTLERIDVCIATKAAQEPSVDAFLRKY